MRMGDFSEGAQLFVKFLIPDMRSVMEFENDFPKSGKPSPKNHAVHVMLLHYFCFILAMSSRPNFSLPCIYGVARGCSKVGPK
jgi:hypothetical protein